eukprot:scaffold12817_cov75-Phaeocystis_antarctica.AAC.8
MSAFLLSLISAPRMSSALPITARILCATARGGAPSTTLATQASMSSNILVAMDASRWSATKALSSSLSSPSTPPSGKGERGQPAGRGSGSVKGVAATLPQRALRLGKPSQGSPSYTVKGETVAAASTSRSACLAAALEVRSLGHSRS